MRYHGFVTVLAILSLAVAAIYVGTLTTEQRTVATVDQQRRNEIAAAFIAAWNRGGEEDAKKALATLGMAVLEPDEVSIQVSGVLGNPGDDISGDIRATSVVFARDTTVPWNEWLILGTLEWESGQWDSNTGTYETLALHFATTDGTKPKRMTWKSNTGGLAAYHQKFFGGWEHCTGGWVHKYDLANGGIVFNFQDRLTSLVGSSYCGHKVHAMAWLDNAPEPPFHAILSYEHTWRDGEFESANIGLNGETLGLNVTYRANPLTWQMQRQQRYDAVP